MKIRFNGREPIGGDRYEAGIIAENKAELVQFIVAQEQGDLDLSAFKAYLVSASPMYGFVDKEALEDIESDGEGNLVLSWRPLKKHTLNNILYANLEFENDENGVVWRTNQLTFVFGDGVMADEEICNLYPSILQKIANDLAKIKTEIANYGFKIVEDLPVTDISTTTVYLLRNSSGEEGNEYIEYIYADGQWEELGKFLDLNLDNYYSKQESDDRFVSRTLPQTIDGTKTFHDTVNLDIQPTEPQHAVRKDYVDTKLLDKANKNNVYTKTETYSQTEVNALLANIKTVNLEIVSVLPTATAETYFAESKTIYLVPNTSSATDNYYDEYITVRRGQEGAYTYSWELIGTTQVDLSNYYTKTESDNKYAQKTTTIAGIDLQDNITKNELAEALGVGVYPTIAVAVAQIVGAGNDVYTTAQFIRFTPTQKQAAILANNDYSIIKLDLTALGNSAPAPYVWLRRNTVIELPNPLNPTSTIPAYQFTCGGEQFWYENYQTDIAIKNIGNAALVYVEQLILDPALTPHGVADITLLNVSIPDLYKNIGNKLDKVSFPNKIYGTDSNGAQTTYDKDSFLDNLNIKNGTGDYSLIQKQASGKQGEASGLGSVIFGGFRGDKSNTPNPIPNDDASVNNLDQDAYNDTVSKSTGIQSYLFGAGNRAYGDWNFIMGKDSKTCSRAAYIFGDKNYVGNPNNGNMYLYSMAVGSLNSVNSTNTFVAGAENTVANANGAVALGVRNTITGVGSKAIGTINIVSGNYSIALGNGLTVSNDNQIVLGNYNGTLNSDILLALGNGSGISGAADEKSNAFEVTETGIVRAFGTPVGNNDLTPKSYVDALKPLSGAGAPTSSTAANYLGQAYIDTANKIPYMCVGIDNGTYTWVAIAAVSLDYSSTN